METIQPPIQWVANELGEESMELNLHSPHAFIACTGSLFHFILRSQGPGERSRYSDWATGWTVRVFETRKKREIFLFSKTT